MSNYGISKICEAALLLIDGAGKRETLALVWETKLFAVAETDVTPEVWKEILALRNDLHRHDGTKHLTPTQVSARRLHHSKLNTHRHNILSWAIDLGGSQPRNDRL